MNFLAPLFLFGAAAVALPVVFHLIRRNTRQRTPFSSLLFLQPTPPRMRQRSRLEDLLLLALRCAVIALLAASFARPFLPRDLLADPTPAAGRRLVLLVDVSASMQRAGLWEAALRRVADTLRDTRPGDQVSLVTFASETTPRVSFDAWNAAPLEARTPLVLDRLRDTGPGWAATHLDQALIHAADSLLEGGDDPFKGRRHIVLVSDLQEGARLERLQAYDWPRDVSVAIAPLTPPRPANAGFQLLTDSSALPGATNAAVRVRVSNAADARTDRLEIAWAGPGPAEPRTPPTEVRVAPGGSRVVRLDVPPGPEVDRLVLRGDDEPFDNTLFLVPPTVSGSRLLYLGAEAADDPREPLFFLRRAFPETNLVGVAVDARSPEAPLTEEAMARAGLIIVGGQATPTLADALRRQAEAGRTILFVVRGPESAAPLARLLGVPSVGVEEVRPANYALLGGVDLRHPLLTAFADPRFSDFTKIRIWRHRRLALDALPGLRVPLRFDSGEPALAELTVGRGRVLILATGWHPADSQLAVSSKFVPLLYAMLEGDSAGPRPATLASAVGEPLALPDAPGAPRRLVLPDGSTTNLPAGSTRFDGTGRPGIYTLAAEPPGRPLRFAVNLDPAESRTSPLPVEDLERLGLVLHSAPADPVAAPERARHLAAAEAEGRQKLWRWALVATLLFILLETALAGRLTRQATPAGGATA